MLCYRRSLRTEEIGELLLRQPHRLVFKPHLQPYCLVRLIDHNLILYFAHNATSLLVLAIVFLLNVVSSVLRGQSPQEQDYDSIMGRN